MTVTAESKIAVTEGSGKNVHTIVRTVGASDVQDDVAIIGEPFLPTYSAVANPTVGAAVHAFQIMAGASLNVVIRQVRITQRVIGTAGTAELQVLRVTSAGTGGTVVTPQKYDNGDAAAGATAMSVVVTPGAEGVELYRFFVPTIVAEPKTQIPTIWSPPVGTKGWVIPAGTTNGIVFKSIGAIATVTLFVCVEFVERNYL